MDLRQIAKDTAKTLSSYLTYQAMRTVAAQLDETDPPRAHWLRQFANQVGVQDGEAFLRSLFRERQELAFRILTVREHIAEEIAEVLPEMLRSTIQQANIEQRRQQLERMTQVSVEANHPDGSIDPAPSRSESRPDSEHGD
ncbi:RuBisCO chaperone RbcX [Leptolyngbya ohadii]|uniref:RuBisCO chaperone RbcX n=1 Tax=Leptolyngbya ohadii TaxID=1962290 RepID=UPI000B59C406|nr:chaperonin family protein RbcX [Leptolyngbya ohadii]